MENKKKKYNALIVDDTDLLTELGKRYFERHGEFDNVYVAKDGKEALGVLGNNSIDVVVTDIEMPFMNGVDLAREMLAQYPNVAFIVHSSDPEKYKRQLEEIKILYLLEKPRYWQSVPINAIKAINRETIEGNMISPYNLQL